MGFWYVLRREVFVLQILLGFFFCCNKKVFINIGIIKLMENYYISYMRDMIKEMMKVIKNI